jgi:3-hydroxybutyryl-CoA dehydrogenase
MEINSICVCGAGTMGSGIAQAAAQSGIYTILFDLNTAVLSNAEKNITASLSALITKGKITKEESDAVIKRLYFTNEMDNCLADVFIEAIVEQTAAKVALFNQLAELNHSECVFATNTSSLSVTSMAALVQRPERVIGMHFFNPATLMKLVEVVLTEYTNEQTKKTILTLATQMNKVPVLCKDAPGFIVNRVARPYYIEALRMAEEGVPIEQIDELMENAGFKLGPFKLMDLIGNDVNYAVSNSVYEQLGRPAHLQPSEIQQAKIAEGKLGKKTGEGYYKY